MRGRVSKRWYSSWGWICAFLGGCSLSLEPRRAQCVRDEDCGRLGDGSAESVCVDSLCTLEQAALTCENAAPPTSNSKGPFKVTLQLRDIVSDAPLNGIRARLCHKLDVHCDDPVSREVSSDATGALRFEVEREFNGYLEITGEDVGRSLYFFHPPIDRDQEFAEIELLSVAIAPVLAAQTGAQWASDRGLLLLRSVGCQGVPAAGVRYGMDEVDPMRDTYYAVDGLPSTAAMATDADGYGGFVNIAPGVAAVKVYAPDDDSAQSTLSLLVRPGAVTYSRVTLTSLR